MSKGVLVFACNNSKIDYVKQAYFLAKRVKQYLGIGTAIATNSVAFLQSQYPDCNEVFEHIIKIKDNAEFTHKRYYDGSLTQEKLEFNNNSRTSAHDITPYDETLLLDSDMVIGDSKFLNSFDSTQPMLAYKDEVDLAGWRDYSEFKKISDTGPDFYWATCVYFRKDAQVEVFFDLLKHIQKNWHHFKPLYQLPGSTFRNDWLLSIAIHLTPGFVGCMPGTLFYATDRDLLWEIQEDEYFVLVEKENYLGEYTGVKFKGSNLHVMNKFSLNRCIDEQL